MGVKPDNKQLRFAPDFAHALELARESSATA
jgi:hypothetical protein